MAQAVEQLEVKSSTAVPFVDLKRQQNMAIKEIREAFDRVTGACSYIQGREVENFEIAWAEYCGVSHCVGCANGTDALVLAFLALGIGPGDEVITVSHTFFATVEAIVAVGATPVLIDVLASTALMDPAKLHGAISARTKAIVPVHLYGQPADMDAIVEIANRRKIPVIGDGAQAHGAAYNKHGVARYGLGTCFSFFPGKNLGALGDAGAIVTNDAGFAQELRCLRDHGRRGKKYEHEHFAWNMRMDGMQAAFLSAKLPYLDGWTRDRANVSDYYRPRLKCLGRGLRIIDQSPHASSAHHLFVVCHSERETLQKALEQRGIGTGVHYPHGVHRQAAWAEKFAPISLPVTEQIADECLSLPLFGAMREEEAEIVVERLARALTDCEQGR